MDEIIVFGMSLDVVWLPILIGIIIGLILPLRPFIRNKLDFTIRPNKEETLNKDVADLHKIIKDQNRENLTGFCNILRKLGLTLYIK